MSDLVTVLIPTSPIPSHPSTRIIEHTLKSAREHFPAAPIFIMCDGVREEQSHYLEPYKEYLGNLAVRVSERYNPTKLLVFGKFKHQAAMTRDVLQYVETPLVLFMEHDTFFLDGLPVDWEGISRVILSEKLNMVGFHCQWEPWIIPEHEWLMLDKERHYIDGVPFVRTWQWSQRPHLASTEFYRSCMRYFSKDCRTMIEDRMVRELMAAKVAFSDCGEAIGWNDWRIAYYAPEGSIRRTWTEDGREGDQKFDMAF